MAIAVGLVGVDYHSWKQDYRVDIATFFDRVDAGHRKFVFDFMRGAVYEYAKPVRVPVPIDFKGTASAWSFRPGDRGSYDGGVLKQDVSNPPYLSIVNLYAWLALESRRLSALGGVAALRIASHATFGGPVLMNSYHRDSFLASPILSTQRDPTDVDPRRHDFGPESFPVGALQSAKAAFSAAAVIEIAGCNSDRTVMRLVRETAKAIRSAGSVAKALRTRIQVRMDERLTARQREVLGIQVFNRAASPIFPGAFTPALTLPWNSAYPQTLRTTVATAIVVMAGFLEVSFAYKMANGLNVRVAALPGGTYSEWNRAKGGWRLIPSPKTRDVVRAYRDLFALAEHDDYPVIEPGVSYLDRAAQLLR